MYVIAAQECMYDARKGFSSCGDDWKSFIIGHMGDQYDVVESTSMWEIRLIVFIRKSLAHNITNVAKSKEATGIGHMLGNKGGVAIGFNYLESSLAFVNSHLAAHQIEISARNQDVQEIISNLKLSGHEDVTTSYQYTFWCGDLNYRIEGTREGVVQLVKEKKLNVLFQNDQLYAEMQKNNVFFGFEEGLISFKPTYKFDRGTRAEYSEELQRVPSWCDRVLWDAYEGSPLTQLSYDAAHELMTSDHSPVYSVFELGVLRPYVPKKFGTSLIGLYDLHARGLPAMDANGFSDPYITFSGSFLKRSGKSSTKLKSLNPNWIDEFVILEPIVSDTEYLSHQFLKVAVWDRDIGSSNDLIGRATISLDGRVDGDVVPFMLNLRKRGIPRGTLSGKLVLIKDVPPALFTAMKRGKKDRKDMKKEAKGISREAKKVEREGKKVEKKVEKEEKKVEKKVEKEARKEEKKEKVKEKGKK
eukprot:TRINITY_DN2547_c0_g1_i1.p1 TRINITY_DN2547_c0_g1~~TRINITY_DN2547_c0_g1_i1.p1  ORF type:complete len:516 (-),score=108.15 TRINITY_DN2547_c0_g1_i1:245-1660(-)